MGNIGDNPREIEFEPLEPATAPRRTPETPEQPRRQPETPEKPAPREPVPA